MKAPRKRHVTTTTAQRTPHGTMVSSHESNTVGLRQHHGAQQKRHGDATEATWTHHGRTRGTSCADTMEEPWGHHQGALWTPHAPPRYNGNDVEKELYIGEALFFFQIKCNMSARGHGPSIPPVSSRAVGMDPIEFFLIMKCPPQVTIEKEGVCSPPRCCMYVSASINEMPKCCRISLSPPYFFCGSTGATRTLFG